MHWQFKKNNWVFIINFKTKILLIFSPKEWREKNENGKEFQTSNQHQKRTKPLGTVREVSKIIDWAYRANCWPYIS